MGKGGYRKSGEGGEFEMKVNVVEWKHKRKEMGRRSCVEETKMISVSRADVSDLQALGRPLISLIPAENLSHNDN